MVLNHDQYAKTIDISTCPSAQHRARLNDFVSELCGWMSGLGTDTAL